MHVMLASVSAATSPTGVCRHAANIVQGLLAFSSVQKISMFTGAWQSDYFHNAFHLDNRRLNIIPISEPNTALGRNLWHLRGLPAAARRHEVDLIHLAFPMPVLPAMNPIVVSLHDLYPFDMTQNFGRRAWLNRAALKLCLRNVDAIACVSEETHARANQLFPALARDKATVVPNSIYLSHSLDCAPLPDSIQGHPIVLCVAQHRANKNLALLIRSFGMALDRDLLPPGAKLVIVGIEGPETRRLQQLVTFSGISRQIVFLRGLSDAQLSTLYATSEVVIAPSLLEGFGLPVAEALSFGSRVICSDIPAFRAFNDPRCTFFDPFDESGESILTALRCVLQSPRSVSPSRVGLYPQHAAAKYLDLYLSLLRHKRVDAPQPRPVRYSTVAVAAKAEERRSQ